MIPPIVSVVANSGTGKTTLAKALARAIGADFHRIQFTPDLMPADVTGGAGFIGSHVCEALLAAGYPAEAEAAEAGA